MPGPRQDAVAGVTELVEERLTSRKRGQVLDIDARREDLFVPYIVAGPQWVDVLVRVLPLAGEDAEVEVAQYTAVVVALRGRRAESVALHVLVPDFCINLTHELQFQQFLVDGQDCVVGVFQQKVFPERRLVNPGAFCVERILVQVIDAVQILR